jgi:hypothetical protein
MISWRPSLFNPDEETLLWEEERAEKRVALWGG